MTVSPLNRGTSLMMAADAGFAALTIAGWSLARYGRPLAAFNNHPGLVVLILMFPLFLYLTELYDQNRRWSPAITVRVLLTVAVTTALFGSAHFLFSRSPDLVLFLAAMTGLMAVEVLAVRVAVAAKAGRGKPSRTALVVGAGWSGRLIIDTIIRDPRLGIRVAGILDDSPQKRNFSYKGVSVLGNKMTMAADVERLGVNMIIVAISYAANADLIKLLLEQKMRGVEVVDMPHIYERITGQIPIKQVEDLWFLHSGGFDILHRPWLKRFKRVTDLAVSLGCLLLAMPLMGIIALVIKATSRGPVFFRQERIGQDEKPFMLYKFRSMRHGAEDTSGPVWAKPGDNRITAVGRFLRITRLDEIPQFINVLKGDMSFIGPRPERMFFVSRLKELIPYYSFRFTVKPGLTGWAQVKYHYGASTEDAVEKLKYDLYYIKNMSPWLDLLIMLKTTQVVLFARGT